MAKKRVPKANGRPRKPLPVPLTPLEQARAESRPRMSRPPLEKWVACYVRVSDFEQNEAGQHLEIDRWLQGNGIEPGRVHWYVDKGLIGRQPERPAFDKLQVPYSMGTSAPLSFINSTDCVANYATASTSYAIGVSAVSVSSLSPNK